jgi:hypothetical protein
VEADYAAVSLDRPVLILKRASKHRASGPWSDDDYDVFDGKQHVGRIIASPATARG